MDFSKFRQTGDLSDLMVEVNGTTFKLHKFPLYARSEYFCKLARGHDVGKIELSDFPGGPDTFSLVADFCYNMPVDMSKTNVVQIRCAAEFLKMGGAGNLIETSDKFLKDTITSSKMSRATPCIASLLLSCSTIGHLANECGVVGQCFDALIDCWLKPPTKFSSPTNIMKQMDRREDKTVVALLSLPLDWFVNMLVTAREKGVRVSLLAELATSYISIAVEREEADEKQARDKSADAGDTISSATPLSASLNSNGGKSGKKPVDISTVLDNIILELPEESLFDDVVTIDWLTKVIRIATANCCQCRRVLVKSAGEMLTKLSAEDLCIISPSLLHDIVGRVL
ncbi:hypothetical protein FSP39_008586 [Pinctada imbricata]|uniref:BTB domain-containing protein n=1 Tax=Pinctada imbricata TaxID=66713 RepID=A0AA88Y9Q2_PINIB|nr:hypothetical protein FSP39_008586 [Pinctada imbricata]